MLAVIIMTDLVPLKIERFWHVPYFVKNRQRMAKVVYPKFGPSKKSFGKVWINFGSPELPPKNLELTQPIEKIARKDLSNRIAGIKTKAIARAVAKAGGQAAAENKHILAGFLVQAYNIVSEKADTRSWHTMPGNIRVGVYNLPTGEYPLKIEAQTTRGAFYSKTKKIKIKRGKWSFLVHYLSSRSTTP